MSLYLNWPSCFHSNKDYFWWYLRHLGNIQDCTKSTQTLHNALQSSTTVWRWCTSLNDNNKSHLQKKVVSGYTTWWSAKHMAPCFKSQYSEWNVLCITLGMLTLLVSPDWPEYEGWDDPEGQVQNRVRRSYEGISCWDDLYILKTSWSSGYVSQPLLPFVSQMDKIAHLSACICDASLGIPCLLARQIYLSIEICHSTVSSL